MFNIKQSIYYGFLITNAIKLLENNKDRIDWHLLSANPSIFVDEPMNIILKNDNIS